jgi:hypothetical protein
MRFKENTLEFLQSKGYKTFWTKDKPIAMYRDGYYGYETNSINFYKLLNMWIEQGYIKDKYIGPFKLWGLLREVAITIYAA